MRNQSCDQTWQIALVDTQKLRDHNQVHLPKFTKIPLLPWLTAAAMSFPDVTHLPLFEHALNDSSIEQTFGFDNMGLVHQPSPQVDKSPTQIFSSSAKPKFHLRMYANPNIVGCHSKRRFTIKKTNSGNRSQMAYVPLSMAITNSKVCIDEKPFAIEHWW